MIDPTMPSASYPMGPDSLDSSPVALESVLVAQLQIARAIQEKLQNGQESMTPRDFKDLVGAASNIVSLAHRTEETLRTITTLNLFVDTVMEFLRLRSDQTGEDLLSELRRVAESINAGDSVSKVMSDRSYLRR